MTLEELAEKLKEYSERGFYSDIVEAHRFAMNATRNFIARTHPQVAFGGKKLGDNLFKIYKKEFEIVGDGNIKSMIYADYFARWYNTGAQGRIIRGRGARRGERGPSYPPRGDYFGSNKAAIEDFFAKQLEEYLKKHVSL